MRRLKKWFYKLRHFLALFSVLCFFVISCPQNASALTYRIPSTSVDLWVGSAGQQNYRFNAGLTDFIHVSAQGGDLFRMQFNFGSISAPKGNSFTLDYSILYTQLGDASNLPIFSCPIPQNTSFYFDTCDISIVDANFHDTAVYPSASYNFVYNRNTGQYESVWGSPPYSTVASSANVVFIVHVSGRVVKDNFDTSQLLFNQRLSNAYNAFQAGGSYEFAISSGTLYFYDEYSAEVAAINEQSEQDKEQYEKEKEEESQREQEMSGNANSAASLFSFSFTNPFEPIFRAFTSGSCVAIPNVARMVGSNDTQYCSWFSASTRSTVTPVISLFSMVILFGFLVKWLTGSNLNGSVEV